MITASIPYIYARFPSARIQKGVGHDLAAIVIETAIFARSFCPNS